MEKIEPSINKGYKQTDVGIIPEDWEVKRLNEVANIVRGGSPRPAGDPRYFNGDFIPWVTVAALTNIPESQLYVTETAGHLTESGSKHSRILNVDTLIIANSGFSLGIAKILGLKSCANDGIAALQKVDSKTDKTFVVYYLNTITNHLRKNVAIGNDQPNLNIERIGKIPFPYPSLPEQQAIAEVLSDVDALITSLDQLVAKKRNIKQGAMQLLLTGKKRLAGFSGEWQTKTLGEIAQIKTGKKNNEDKVENGLFPFFVRSQTVERINSYSFDGEAILVPGEGGIGSIYHYINGKFDYHQRVYKISDFSEEISGNYVYFCMLQNFNDQAMKNSVKATVDSLRLPTFQEFELKLPPTIEEQKAIAQILSEMDAEIEALEIKRDKYKVVKQGVMQKLLTGRIRLI